MEHATKVISLSELVSEISETLGDRFNGEQYYIVAETSDIKNYPERGYCFVTLIEKEGNEVIAKMEAVIWRRNYHILTNFEFTTGTRFEKNLKVLLKTEVFFNPVYGLRLEILEIDTSFTLGQLELERQQTLNELLRLNPETIRLIDGNWITFNKRLAKPAVIQRIALVTAPGSDGLRDFRHELENNPFDYKFDILEFLTQVQGKNADQSIISALQEIEEKFAAADVVVIVRGGGSRLDFTPFETYDIGKAIAEFPKVIITGIGHERNVSIADLMSNTAVKTPTRAAAFILEHNRAFEEEVIRMKERIALTSEELIEGAKVLFDDLRGEFISNTKQFLEKHQHAIEKLSVAIRHLSPENILARGFAIVSCDGKIITDPGLLQPGDNIEVTLKDSIIHSKITQIEP